MYRKVFIYTLFFLKISILNTFAQQKYVEAYKTQNIIKIDGILNEEDWINAGIAKDFVTIYPIFGENPKNETLVKILYNNNSVYFGIILFDNHSDSIYTNLTPRDDYDGNVDFFEISLNPNNDGQNIFDFVLSAANVQTDIRISEDIYDYSWDAVWYSAVKITDTAWIAEIEIPYAAIRFPKKNEHEWSVNFIRTVRRTREKSSWYPVDKRKGSDATQMGLITGIKNINVPLRFSLVPYASGYINSYDKSFGYSFGYGLDMKLGLSETYTLDMTLIPDFGQTKTDELVLNLTPHETYYNENRPFFTEGTELFNKAGLFYSRRIGKKPELYDSISNLSDIEIIKNQNNVPLINAFKISGRNSKNLAIGFFNAITANATAKINDQNDNLQTIITENAANYNLIVLDKTFGLNNYVNFSNSNVFKPAKNYMANVSAILFKLMNKTNKYGIASKISYSYRNSNFNNIDNGFYLSTSYGKMNGNWIYTISNELVSKNYNINDMGYLTIYNQTNNIFNLEFRKFSRFLVFNETKNSLSLSYSTLMDISKFTEFEINLSNYATTIKHLSIWNTISWQPVSVNDYYEPRHSGMFYKRPGMFSEYFFLSTDYRKKIAVDFKFDYYADSEQRHGIWTSISPLAKFGKKIEVRYTFSADYDLEGCGFYQDKNDDIIFSRRDVISFTNSLNLDYIFSPTFFVSLKARHYTSTVDNFEFYTLQNDGNLLLNEIQDEHTIYNFNIFNIDLLFSWNFLPGSYLSIMWKNQIFNSGNTNYEFIPSYYENFKNIWLEPMANSFSIKFNYYLDYYTIFKRNSNK